MSNEVALVSLAWSGVYGGLAAFFLVVAPRFKSRGYHLLGLSMVGIALGTFGTWLARSSGPSHTALLGGRLLVLGSALAPAFNTHFVMLFTGHLRAARQAWLGYALAASAILVDMITEGMAGISGRAYPAGFLAARPTLACFVGGLLALQLAVAAVFFFRARRLGHLGASFPLALLVFLGPFVAYDTSALIRTGEHYFITEPLTWIYGLVIKGVLLNELLGKEGLLETATSNLAVRTQELETSYVELELMHRELMKKEQLAAVGELAASIAHEVRNPLAIIMNAASGLKRQSISENDRGTLLSIVDEEAARLNHLVAELLRFARPMTAERSPASVLDICNQAKEAAPPGCDVVVSADEHTSISRVWVDPGLFRLALDNLLLNAAQAMAGQGKVLIRIQSTAMPEGGPAVGIEVEDQGPGMTEAEMEQARKPFFTTKPRGTGLGIPITERVLDAHGGRLQIESQKGKGTTMRLLIPWEDASEPRYPGSRSPSQRRRFRSFPELGTAGGDRPSRPSDTSFALGSTGEGHAATERKP